MSQSFSVLLRLSAEHAYFTAATGFRFAPTPQCATLLDRLGILARADADGLALIAQPGARADLTLPSLRHAAFEFAVFAGDPHFSLYTAIGNGPDGAVLYFHSAGACREASGRWRLHAGELAGADAWRRTAVPNQAAALASRSFNPVKPAFYMVLSLDDVARTLAADAAAGTAPTFLVRFGARQSVWKYHFLNDLGVKHPAIVDLDGALVFTPGGMTPLPGKRSALTFVSDRAIDMRQTPAQRLQLRELSELGERILIKRLPNASVAAVGREIAAGSAVPVLVSEIFIS